MNEVIQGVMGDKNKMTKVSSSAGYTYPMAVWSAGWKDVVMAGL